VIIMRGLCGISPWMPLNNKLLSAQFTHDKLSEMCYIKHFNLAILVFYMQSFITITPLLSNINSTCIFQLYINTIII